MIEPEHRADRDEKLTAPWAEFGRGGLADPKCDVDHRKNPALNYCAGCFGC